MKVQWTFITEKHHFANGLQGRKTYWILVQREDKTLSVEIDGTDKYGDFPDNDSFKENPTYPMRVIAFAEMDKPEPPETIPEEMQWPTR